jgi:hypothetical protein
VELNQHHTAVGAATQVDGLGLVTAWEQITVVSNGICSACELN